MITLGIRAAQLPLLGGGGGALYTYNALTDTASGSSTAKPTCSRSAPGYALNAAGLWVPFAANTLRRTDRCLLVEKASTNIALQSSGGMNSPWTTYSGSTRQSSSILQPKSTGAAAATDIIHAANTESQLFQGLTVPSAAYVESLYARMASGTADFTMRYYNGGGNSLSPVKTATTAWQRFSFGIIGSNNGNGNVSIANASSGAPTMAFTMYQVEPGSDVTSPIDTTTVAVTRDADLVNMPVAGATSAKVTLLDTTVVNVTGISASSPWQMTAANLNRPISEITKIELFA